MKINLFESPNLIQLPREIRNLKSIITKVYEDNLNEDIEIIPIMTDSNGGDVEEMYALINAIKCCSKPVATFCLGSSHSAALNILASGTKNYRFASKEAVCLLHYVRKTVRGKPLRHLRDTKIYCSTLDESCSKEPDFFFNLIKNRVNQELLMYSDDLLSNNIIDHLGLPIFEKEDK